MSIADSLCHIWGSEGDLHFDLADVTLMSVLPEGEDRVIITIHFDGGQSAVFGTTQDEGAELVKAHANRRSIRNDYM